MVKLYAEFTQGSSSKFWAVGTSGSTAYVNYGKIGANGVTQVKSFGSADEAEAFAEKTYAQKVKKGYKKAPVSKMPTIEGMPKGAGGAAAAAAPKAKAKAAPKAKAKAKAPAKKPAPKPKAKATKKKAPAAPAKKRRTTRGAVLDEESEDEKEDDEDEESEDDGGQPLAGLKLCVTGTLTVTRKVFTRLIEDAGGKVVGKMSKAVDYLVSTEQSTTKAIEARKAGTKVVTEAWIRAKIDGSGGDDDDDDDEEDDDGSDGAAAGAGGAGDITVADLNAQSKTAYVPVHRALPASYPPLCSRFGGNPFMLTAEAWPKCGICSKELDFICQINLKGVPSAVRGLTGHGLFQLFLCEELCGFQQDEPFYVTRILPLGSDGAVRALPDGRTNFPANQITAWTPKDDLPHFEEYEYLFPDREAPDELEDMEPLGGEKLLGWPNYSQGRECGICPKCKKDMEPLFQVEGGKPFFPRLMIGDAGTLNVFQCAKHKDQLVVTWACS